MDTPTLTRSNPDTILICPACGGENPANAVFCANHQCHKALGEFKYVLEELDSSRSAIEKLADKVSDFIAKPQFIIIHVLWFAVWILLNQGVFDKFEGFDTYPYSLLSFILAIEAVLVTGFLLISQNHQYAYSEKRAELDYEVNVRAYRKLLELENRIDRLLATDQDSTGTEDHA